MELLLVPSAYEKRTAGFAGRHRQRSASTATRPLNSSRRKILVERKGQCSWKADGSVLFTILSMRRVIPRKAATTGRGVFLWNTLMCREPWGAEGIGAPQAGLLWKPEHAKRGSPMAGSQAKHGSRTAGPILQARRPRFLDC